MSRSKDALESFMIWYLSQVGDEEDISPTLSYKKMKQILFNIPLFRVIEYLHCTQVGSKRYVTTGDTHHGNVFPNVITERFHDRWCTDLFGNTWVQDYRLSRRDLSFYCIAFQPRYNRTLLERAILNFNLQHGAGTQILGNVIFSDGNLNPYRSNGVAEYDNKTSQFVNTKCDCHNNILFRFRNQKIRKFTKIIFDFSLRQYGRYIWSRRYRHRWISGSEEDNYCCIETFCWERITGMRKLNYTG